MSAYSDDVREAARRYHLTWCEHPHCVHTPFDTDLEAVGPILSIAEPVYTQRDLLVAACHHLAGVVGALASDLAHLDSLRARVDVAHATIAEAIG